MTQSVTIHVFSLLIGLGCDRPFCGAYWNALGINRTGSFPVCSQDTLRPVWTPTFFCKLLLILSTMLSRHLFYLNERHRFPVCLGKAVDMISCSRSYKLCLSSLQISEHAISRIPLLAHEKNLHEQNVCISRQPDIFIVGFVVADHFFSYGYHLWFSRSLKVALDKWEEHCRTLYQSG